MHVESLAPYAQNAISAGLVFVVVPRVDQHELKLSGVVSLSGTTTTERESCLHTFGLIRLGGLKSWSAPITARIPALISSWILQNAALCAKS